ncbi:LOW QUALITY PROTEIN: heat shock transcription factor, X-linked-like [Sarcophilus harrisii]|uniref:LOW QUALITY PROTEIN: heat shock transcription factor, X-linked-like n=1 Tax=Sarcophilus harrisii TaxID=9305 RepID=UPI001301ACBF|nr:LOW QUALITY PROTEIN: heat shock transcription factor, X-linked-like [Sarcophilus harrisii]
MESEKSESEEHFPGGEATDTEQSSHSTFSSAPPEEGEIPIMDADLRALVEESAFQALTEGPLAKRTCFSFATESLAMEESEFFSLTFPRKLWKIVESDRFQSICWNEDGTCIVIDEEQFKVEILEKRSAIRIFETDCMKSFIRQLNLYGFSKVRQDVERSASLQEFLVEERAACPLNKLFLACNPSFKRGCPQLLSKMKRRVGVKNTSGHPSLPTPSPGESSGQEQHPNPEDPMCAPAGKCAKKRSAATAAAAAAAAASACCTAACCASASTWFHPCPASASTSVTSSAPLSASASSTFASISTFASVSTSAPSPVSFLAPAVASTSRETGPRSAEAKPGGGKKVAPGNGGALVRGGFPAGPLLSGGFPAPARLSQFGPFHLPPLMGHRPLPPEGLAAPASLFHTLHGGSLRPMMYPAMYSELTAFQTHVAGLLPFWGPCYSMPMVTTTPAGAPPISDCPPRRKRAPEG